MAGDAMLIYAIEFSVCQDFCGVKYFANGNHMAVCYIM